VLSALHRWLVEQIGVPKARISVVAAAALGACALMLLWPSSPNETPAAIGADLLWDFRLHSIGTLAVMWSSLGLSFAWLNRPDRRIPGVDSVRPTTSSSTV